MISAYIAGAFRAKNNPQSHWEVAQNVRAAEQIALACCRLGLATICPHANTAHFQGECTDEFWIEMTKHVLRMVAKDQGILICLPGAWKTSAVTLGELWEAKRLGMDRFEVGQVSDDPALLGKAKRLITHDDETFCAIEIPGLIIDTLEGWISCRKEELWR